MFILVLLLSFVICKNAVGFEIYDCNPEKQFTINKTVSINELRKMMFERGTYRLRTLNECLTCANCEKSYMKKLAKGLKNKEIRVIIYHMEPYVIFRNRSHTIELTGYLGELWKILEERFDFRSVYQVGNFSYGKEVIEKGLADVMLSPYVITSDDTKKFDYIMTFASSHSQLYIKSRGNKPNSYYYIFTWNNDLWVAFVGTIFIFTFLFWGITFIRKQYELDSVLLSTPALHNLAKRLKVTLHPSATSLSLSNSFFCVLGAVTIQGVGMRPYACSVRLVTLVCLLFGSLMYTSFSAVLVSRLAITRDDTAIKNLDDLLVTQSYSLCIRRNAHALELFKQPNNNYLKPEWHEIINRYPCVVTNVEKDGIVKSLCKDKTVILETQNIMNGILESMDECSITELKGKYAFNYVSIPVRKKFPYTKLLTIHLVELRTAGIIDLIRDRWLARKAPRIDPSSVIGDVSINHVESVLYLYIFAVCISTVILIAELIYFYINFRSVYKCIYKAIMWKPNTS